MERRKLAVELTEEELFNILNSSSTETVEEENTQDYKYRNDILGFIHAYDIKPGEHRIGKRALNRLYNYWSENPISKQMFSMEINEYLPNNTTSYFINKDALKIKLLINELRKKRLSTKIPSNKTHFDNYLKNYSLEKGTFFVPVDALYYLYDKWIYKNNNKNPLGKESFYEFCKLYFVKKTVKKNDKLMSFFGIKKDSILAHLSMEQIEHFQGTKKNEKKET